MTSLALIKLIYESDMFDELTYNDRLLTHEIKASIRDDDPLLISDYDCELYQPKTVKRPRPKITEDMFFFADIES
jgi:hypothetical protein